MPELIWYKRFPQDWMSDPQLGRCSPAARGVWADIIENLYLSNDAWLTGPTEELARVCRCGSGEFLTAIKELKKHKVGEIESTDGQHKIGCRRIIRALKLRELKRKAGIASANRRSTHTPTECQQTPQHLEPTEGATRSASASASEYASASASEYASELPSENDAVKLTITAGIPEEFSRYVYQDWSCRSGKDAGGVLVSFLPYVTKRWAREAVEWRNGKHRGRENISKNGTADHSHPIGHSL